MTSQPKLDPLDVAWRTCGVSAECLGAAWEPYDRCLAHLGPAEVESVLRGLVPGQGIDLRGTTLAEDLLTRVLEGMERRLGRARFDRAVFTGPARFGEAVFAGDATFEHARFDHLASFFGTSFTGNVSFGEARFHRQLSLHGARVRGHGRFDRIRVGGDALFSEARFDRDTSFRGADFRGFAAFDGTAFAGDVGFRGAGFRGAGFRRAVSFRASAVGRSAAFDGLRFHGPAYLGPMLVGRRLSLADVRAGGPLHVHTGDCRVTLRAAVVTGPFTARLSAADIDLRDATLTAPSVVTRGGGRVRITSLDDLDAGALTLNGADLRTCGLGGLRRPEGLRLSDCLFATTPAGVRWRLGWPPVRWWTRRVVLADEHLWRGWSPSEVAAGGPPTRRPVDAGWLAALYERVRPGVGDAKTSADFAFAAMEMRRLSSPRVRARMLLSVYWLACGYGLRAGRAIGWLTLVAALAAGTLYWAAGTRPARHWVGPHSRVAVVRSKPPVSPAPRALHR
ncbi:pentapeptide repeat-containing protein [Microbispora sp. RL4-1S]|uniref:Pentapeptide repeat-containing protein n=1 Tax=Microbispora oryzae TaxID=2806554 RepID=A0A940WPB9_9ACTN|nr:pentapeptide repeat-containing protein [Microbispora oryzae]MBP2708593.1 pentapeptide repeat-containing protein [Microbispora oryzae]